MPRVYKNKKILEGEAVLEFIEKGPINPLCSEVIAYVHKRMATEPNNATIYTAITRWWPEIEDKPLTMEFLNS